MQRINRKTIVEEPIPVKAKPIGKIIGAEKDQQHRFSLREGK